MLVSVDLMGFQALTLQPLGLLLCPKLLSPQWAKLCFVTSRASFLVALQVFLRQSTQLLSLSLLLYLQALRLALPKWINF